MRYGKETSRQTRRASAAAVRARRKRERDVAARAAQRTALWMVVGSHGSCRREGSGFETPAERRRGSQRAGPHVLRERTSTPLGRRRRALTTPPGVLPRPRRPRKPVRKEEESEQVSEALRKISRGGPALLGHFPSRPNGTVRVSCQGQLQGLKEAETIKSGARSAGQRSHRRPGFLGQPRDDD